MSQHDMNIANSNGAAVRADVNAALVALAGQNSGATAPVVNYPFMLWADTGTDTLWQRNAANSAWIDKGALSIASRVGLDTGNVQQVDQPYATITRGTATVLTGSLNCLISNTGETIWRFYGTAGVTYSIKLLGGGYIGNTVDLNILQTGSDITTEAGDTARVRMLTGNTCEVFDYQRASGVPLQPIGLGYVQTWQDVKASRAFGVTYYNTTGKPISAVVSTTSGVGAGITATINGVTFTIMSGYSTTNMTGSFIVPPGASYLLSSTGTLSSWAELR